MNSIKSAFFVILFLLSCAQAVSVNPATDYCMSLGYIPWTNHTSEGDYSYCKIPGGAMFRIWDFYIGNVGVEHNYCSQKGLETRIINDSRCSYAPLCAACILQNGTEVEVSELMSEPDKYLSPGEKYPSEENPLEKQIWIYAAIIFLIAISIAYLYRKRNSK